MLSLRTYRGGPKSNTSLSQNMSLRSMKQTTLNLKGISIVKIQNVHKYFEFSVNLKCVFQSWASRPTSHYPKTTQYLVSVCECMSCPSINYLMWRFNDYYVCKVQVKLIWWNGELKFDWFQSLIRSANFIEKYDCVLSWSVCHFLKSSTIKYFVFWRVTLSACKNLIFSEYSASNSGPSASSDDNIFSWRAAQSKITIFHFSSRYTCSVYAMAQSCRLTKVRQMAYKSFFICLLREPKILSALLRGHQSTFGSLNRHKKLNTSLKMACPCDVDDYWRYD